MYYYETIAAYIGPFIVVEEVGDLNYRLILPPYMKTLPIFYVGRLKRYVDHNDVTILTRKWKARRKTCDQHPILTVM